MSLTPGIYWSNYTDDGMVVIVHACGSIRVISDDFGIITYPTDDAERLFRMWGCAPARVVPTDGVIIIDRNDLPEVRGHGADGREQRVEFPDGNGGGIYVGQSANRARREALAWLGAAEYLDAHPPLDMEQYADLVALVAEHDMGQLTGEGIDTLARRLLATGRIEVKR